MPTSEMESAQYGWMPYASAELTSTSTPAMSQTARSRYQVSVLTR
jgi:hypothetical protein